MRKQLYRGKPISSSDFDSFKSINTANYIGDYATGSLIYNASDCKWYICALDVCSADMADINNPVYRIEVDEETNSKIAGFKDIHEGLITTPNSKIPVYVIPTNEEIMIIRDTYDLIQ